MEANNRWDDGILLQFCVLYCFALGKNNNNKTYLRYLDAFENMFCQQKIAHIMRCFIGPFEF